MAWSPTSRSPREQGSATGSAASDLSRLSDVFLASFRAAMGAGVTDARPGEALLGGLSFERSTPDGTRMSVTIRNARGHSATCTIGRSGDGSVEVSLSCGGAHAVQEPADDPVRAARMSGEAAALSFMTPVSSPAGGLMSRLVSGAGQIAGRLLRSTGGGPSSEGHSALAHGVRRLRGAGHPSLRRLGMALDACGGLDDVTVAMISARVVSPALRILGQTEAGIPVGAGVRSDLERISGTLDILVGQARARAARAADERRRDMGFVSGAASRAVEEMTKERDPQG